MSGSRRRRSRKSCPMTWITRDGPQRDVGVQQQAHPPIPKSAAISALVWR